VRAEILELITMNRLEFSSEDSRSACIIQHISQQVCHTSGDDINTAVLFPTIAELWLLQGAHRENESINRVDLLLHFMRCIFHLFKMSATVFYVQPCSFLIRYYCPLCHSGVFSYVSIIIRNPTQESICRVYFGPVGDLVH
jgi:hypothetical protein